MRVQNVIQGYLAGPDCPARISTTLTQLAKLPRATARAVRDQAVRRLLPVAHAVTTITCDNGREFVAHQDIATNLDADFYFADPYASWQRGTNENTNGLLRQYFPKGTDLSRHARGDLDAVAAALNSRPRKTLGWKTPAEALAEHLHSLG